MDIHEWLRTLQKEEEPYKLLRSALECLPKPNAQNADLPQLTRTAQYLPTFLHLTKEYFIHCFHLDMWLVEGLLHELRQRTFYNPSENERSVPFDIRVLATLSFMAHGHLEFITTLDAFKNYTRRQLLDSVPHVCAMIVNFLSPELNRFPHKPAQLDECRSGFLKKHQVPGVVGAIDTFHVRLAQVPLGERKFYTNRRGHLSFKVQLICDHNNRVLDVNPRHPGADSDICIWKKSHVRDMMLQARAQCGDKRLWLIGDRGYQLSPILMNPYRNAQHPQQRAVNQAFQSLHRASFDRTLALLRARFRCLTTILPFGHQVGANIVRACSTLHNYLLTKDASVEEHIYVDMPKQRVQRNARFEDPCRHGADNRNFIGEFLKNNRWRAVVGKPAGGGLDGRSATSMSEIFP